MSNIDTKEGIVPELPEQPHKEKLLAAIHKEKIMAAIENPKAKEDVDLLKEALSAYEHWNKSMLSLKSSGHERIHEMTALLNDYKDYLEIDLVATKGSAFLKRQKGQLKLDKKMVFRCRMVSSFRFCRVLR